ncbi:MAG: phosphoribosyltransferase family protein [Candidatus Omnitrophota bacterium]
MFINRKDAGQKLGIALEKYKGLGALVLAIPRGGVEVGYYAARHLEAELSVIVSRKLPYPDNPEAGFGAIAEDGSVFLFDEARQWLSEDEIKKIMAFQKKEAERRVRVFREGEPLPDLKGRTVILVDDGIAMGSTMRASIKLCRNKEVSRLIVASPVASPDVAVEMRALADDAVILETPAFFQAVAQVYEHWYDVPEEEVKTFLRKSEK